MSDDVEVLWEGEVDGEKVRVRVSEPYYAAPHPIVETWTRKRPDGPFNWFCTDDDGDWFANWQLAGHLATRLRDLEAASRALASKLHEVHGADRYRAVWAIAQAHLGPYDG